MEIYKKLQKARCELLNAGIKKSGKNQYANFEYFELADFLPTVLKIFEKNGLASHFSLNKENAQLIIFNTENTEKEEQIIFTVPFVQAEIKAAAIQNLGATITYLRRYLWLIALELTESDEVDSNNPNINEKIEKEKNEEKEIVEDLYNEFERLLNIKEIPEEKKENIEKVKILYKNKNLKLNIIRNAVKFLTDLPDKTRISFLDIVENIKKEEAKNE